MKIADLPLQYNTVDVLEHNLGARTDKIALYSLEREMTFREVSEEVNQVSNALEKFGVRMDSFVGILSLDVPEWVTSFFGVMKVGGVAVGMSTTLTAPEYAYMLDDSRAMVLIVHETLVPKIEDMLAERVFLKHVVVIGSAQSATRIETFGYDDWIRGESKERASAPDPPG